MYQTSMQNLLKSNNNNLNFTQEHYTMCDGIITELQFSVPLVTSVSQCRCKFDIRTI